MDYLQQINHLFSGDDHQFIMATQLSVFPCRKNSTTVVHRPSVLKPSEDKKKKSAKMSDWGDNDTEVSCISMSSTDSWNLTLFLFFCARSLLAKDLTPTTNTSPTMTIKMMKTTITAMTMVTTIIDDSVVAVEDAAAAVDVVEVIYYFADFIHNRI